MSQQLDNYQIILNSIKEKIRQARIKATFTVNAQLLSVYWNLGKTILEQQKTEGWGTKVIARLAKDLKMEFPDMRGLSERNLVYMQTFAASYPHFPFTQGSLAEIQNTDKQDDVITQGILAKLSWYHHITLLDKVKEPATRLFYIQETVQNGWSRDVMVHQIESNLHQRSGMILSNFKNTIAPEQSELVQQVFKDPYKFEFIYLGKEAKERDLETALTNQLTSFLLELGQYFSFMGRQYKLMLGEKEYFFDLLFYHTRLKRYIVIDLKIDEFKPEYLGKMQFYLNLADKHLKQNDDEKSIGLILCKTKDGLVVEYALRDSSKPIGIAEYKIKELLPENIRGELPSIEELEAEIAKEYEKYQKPIEAKLERLKELISGLKQPKVEETRNPETTKRIFTKVVIPLWKGLKKELVKVSKEFEKTEIMIWTDNQGHKTDKEALAYLKEHKGFNECRIELRLRVFKAAGIKAFDIWKDMCINMHESYYTIGFGRHQPQNVLLKEKLYHVLLDKKELDEVIEKCHEQVLDDIAQQIERIQNQKK